MRYLPKMRPAQFRTMEIAKPGFGGLIVEDLEYELDISQSPDMLNMMLKNGSFGKRYGQELLTRRDNNILARGTYGDYIFLQSGNSIYQWDGMVASSVYEDNAVGAKKGIFFNFNRMLYFLNGSIYLQYDGSSMTVVDPYVPDILINRKPDGSYEGDVADEYNRLGAGFTIVFNGDGSSKTFNLGQTDLDDTPAIVEVDGTVVTTGYTYSHSAGTVVFTNAPASGQNNVRITVYKTESEYINSILNNKYAAAYGGQNNSRLFLAGNGNSTYYFCDVYDASYWPETNNATVGNGEEDITGFGNQYNVLIVFKPTEMYAISYSYAPDSTGDYRATFLSAQVNVEMGCDMPDTIRYVDNRLTWGSTDWGICTLCSTVIEDERNVRIVSRNVNGGHRAAGLLQEENLQNAYAINYEGKYIVCVNGNAYAWDYTNSPFSTSDRITVDTAARRTAWFRWNNFNVDHAVIVNRECVYIKDNKLCQLTYDLNDFGNAIPAHYMTPMLDFDSYEQLKTAKWIYVESRADTPSVTKMRYITDEDIVGELEPRDLIVSSKLWDTFQWATFGWNPGNFARVFARKFRMKKFIMLGVYMWNDEVNKDLSLSGIRILWTLVKKVK